MRLTNSEREAADREAGLFNPPARQSAWTDFLQKSHDEVMSNWPAIRDAMIDARRWENPFHFNGSFAEKVERAKPLPALTTVGQLERLVIRSLVMLGMSQEDREVLIRQEYEAELTARLRSSAEHKPTHFVEVDLSQIQL